MKKISVLLILIATVFAGCKKDESVDPTVQFKHDLDLIDTYLAGKGITPMIDTSGFRYVINTQGTGAVPGRYDTVSARVSTSYLDGTGFSSDTTGRNAFIINQVFTGLELGFLHMQKGSTFTFYFPSALAWGTSGFVGYNFDGQSTFSVPANAVVIFHVTLLDDDAELAKEKKLIDAYSTSETPLQKDSTGLRWIVINPGLTNGNFARMTSLIKMDYSVSVLGSAAVIDSGTGFNFLESDNTIIFGVRHGITKVREGGQIKLYIPSKLAYGFPGSPPGVPKSTPIVYTITLQSVE